MSCGCCEPTSALTPLTVENRDGLTAIAYRIGTYSSFRATMLESISATTELTALTTREDDDASITVLSLWAAVADVLTFYQERYANEAFLRTATQRASVGRLAALIDYRLRPGVAALAWLAFGAEDGKELPRPAWPARAERPRPGRAAADLRDARELHAVGTLSRLRVLAPPYGESPLTAGATEALLDPGAAGRAAAAGLAPRDRVLVWETGSAGSVEELAITAVRIDEDRAALVWDAPLRRSYADGTAAAKGGRTFRLFGHTAPAQAMTPKPDSTVAGGIKWTLGTTNFTPAPRPP